MATARKTEVVELVVSPEEYTAIREMFERDYTDDDAARTALISFFESKESKIL